jgi:hypothetical protein
VQAESSNRHKLRRSRAGVVSVVEKARESAGQVCDEKTNVCEPLLTHRKPMTASKPGAIGTPGRRAGLRACPKPEGGLHAALVVPGV